MDQIVRQVQEQRIGKPRKSDNASTDPSQTTDLVTVHADRVTATQHRAAGPVHVGFQFWKRLEFDVILRRLGFSTKAIQLTCAMTLNRLIHPDSEHAMPDWIRSTALGDILGVDFTGLVHDPLYRNLDRLHPNRAAIESDLVERERNLFQLDSTVYLYDLTSTYFEGHAKRNPKAKRGYSRDKRPDCKQVVVGLVISREGFPIAHEVFDGNTQDRKTLGRILDLLKDRVGMPEGSTVVVDRGMAYAENLEENAFRMMKTPLAERPIFHHLEHRVETHIFLCVLAYHLLVAIETTLLNQGVHTSWATVRKTLSTHQVATIVLPTDNGKVLRIRKGMTPEPAHLELYRLLKVPQEIMHPIKTWS